MVPRSNIKASPQGGGFHLNSSSGASGLCACVDVIILNEHRSHKSEKEQGAVYGRTRREEREGENDIIIN